MQAQGEGPPISECSYETHGEAYQQMLVKRREWYALNSEQNQGHEKATIP